MMESRRPTLVLTKRASFGDSAINVRAYKPLRRSSSLNDFSQFQSNHSSLEKVVHIDHAAKKVEDDEISRIDNTNNVGQKEEELHSENARFKEQLIVERNGRLKAESVLEGSKARLLISESLFEESAEKISNLISNQKKDKTRIRALKLELKAGRKREAALLAEQNQQQSSFYFFKVRCLSSLEDS